MLVCLTGFVRVHSVHIYFTRQHAGYVPAVSTNGAHCRYFCIWQAGIWRCVNAKHFLKSLMSNGIVQVSEVRKCARHFALHLIDHALEGDAAPDAHMRNTKFVDFVCTNLPKVRHFVEPHNIQVGKNKEIFCLLPERCFDCCTNSFSRSRTWPLPAPYLTSPMEETVPPFFQTVDRNYMVERILTM